MNIQAYKKIVITLIIVMATSISLSAQCFCGRMRFRVVLDSLCFIGDSANYSFETTIVGSWRRLPTNYIMPNIQINKESNIKKDTLSFQFGTGSGRDTLQFVIKNHTTNAEMIITVLYMTHDNLYFIDLGHFTQGNYLFDWDKIDRCQTENPADNIVECDGMKFYQLQLKNGDYFNHNE